jgi:aminoglycoside 2'-N-acetyltransferase I
MSEQRSSGDVPQLWVKTTVELDAAERREVVDLCTSAFNHSFENLFELIGEGSDTWHVLLRLEGKLVSHATWSPRLLQPEGLAPLRTAYVDAVATAPAFQGQRLGSLTMQRLAEEIRVYQLGGLSTGRPSFYERLGWERWHGPLAMRSPDGQLIPTPGETVLILRTPTTPALDTRASLIAEWRPEQPW